ncbi:crotonase/enoyl-CoA hydratase family protein [Sphingomonas solaris]|uniref:Crotonase/enoyl-CoA hydratase family protein n=1 Tax=Alterirhizorhabdus solaris TaxID=2529389 RepID=A0A558QXY7_9SPHN|nr:crotonase/enoyl-CoA hydratase family protein [Sphingomonas solaris]TVV72026.1 crotonase/enoyl-CoA hydratase family protein [Sphingomonas solaris]
MVAATARRGAAAGLRAVFLSGEGRVSCAGGDLAVLAEEHAPPLAPRTHGAANLLQQAAWGWRTLPVPVIAAVHGVCFGAGLQIALGADIRLAAPDAQLAMMEARWGLVPDLGGIALLRGLVRDDLARELTYTARRMSGAEAEAIGLVTRTADDPHAEAMVLAHDIAAASPAATRAAKRLFNLAADADAATILPAESTEQAALLAGPGPAEALRAAREGRSPRFAD